MDGKSARQTPTPSNPGQAGLRALAGVIDRLETVLDAETEALEANTPIDLAAVNHRKRQGLLELSRIVPHLPTGALGGEPRQHLERLSRKLDRNRRVLDIQLRAVREVAAIVAAMIREGESDGTYTAAQARP